MLGHFLFICILLMIAPAFAMEGRATSSLGVSPSWSPDGRLIAYQSPAYDIYVMNSDGTHRRALTSDIYRDEQPAWSPDGERIAFVSERGGAQELWVMNSDGTEARRLTSGLGWKHSPSWGPDGKSIAYVVSAEKNGQGDMWIISVVDGREMQLTSGGNARSPAWHPNSKDIAYLRLRHGGYDIILMDLDSGVERLLVGDSHWKGQLSWSPDGASLAFASYRDGDYDIYVLKDGETERMTKRPSWDIAPAWSPDGASIAYASDHGGMYDVWVADLEFPAIAAKEIIEPAPALVPAEAASPILSVAMAQVAEERSRQEERERAPALELSTDEALQDEQTAVVEVASPADKAEIPLDGRNESRTPLELVLLLAFSVVLVEVLSRVFARIKFVVPSIAR